METTGFGINRKHRPGLGRAGLGAGLGVGGYRHRIGGHERLDVIGVGVAQQQIGHLRVEQGIFAAADGGRDAMQDEGADAAFGRVVVPVGMPEQTAVGVGDVSTPGLAGSHLQRGDGIFIGQQVAVQVREPEAFAQPGRDGLVGQRPETTAVNGHVVHDAQAPHGLGLVAKQVAGIVNLHHQIPGIDGIRLELFAAPVPVGRCLAEIERRNRRGRRKPGLIGNAHVGLHGCDDTGSTSA